MTDEFRPPNRVHDLAIAVLGAVVDYYAAAGYPLPDRRLISAGPPAWDCESVAVWVERTHGHEGDINIEAPTALVASAGSMSRAMQAVVTICRCSPEYIDVNDIAGTITFPPPEEITETARLVHYDEPLVTEAIRVGARDGKLPDLNDWSVLGWQVIGPMAGFVASELHVKLGTDWGPPPEGS